MEKQLLKTYGSGCARNIAFQIFSVALVFGLFIIPALIAALWGGDRDTNFTVFIVILIGLMLAGIAGVVIWGLRSIRQRAAHLDEVFAPWGLQGSAFLQSGRQYHGKIRGRQAEIYFRRGPNLEINLAAPLNTQAAVVFKSEIGKLSTSLGDYEYLEFNNPLFHNLSLYALDANWMNHILADDLARKAIRELMRVSGAYQLRQILVLPDGLKLTIRRVGTEEITSDNMNTWIDELFVLLNTLESAPGPQEITVMMPIEPVSNQNDRNSLAWLAAGVGCNVLLALMACGGLVALIGLLVSKLQ
ncbi:MAG: hypothetical protein H8E28_00695 [Anaerolineae bacterium]|nr:hypothetical protein [Anaerolineae bacterium]